MSAWICSHLHVKALAIYGTNHTGRSIGRYQQNDDGKWILTPVEHFPLLHLNDQVPEDLSDATRVARLLITENLKSYCHRHDEEEAKHYWHELNVHVSPADRAHFKTLSLTHIQLLKLIHCLDYQSCEHAEWEQSLAKTILMDLEGHIIPALPGYDEAPWGIDDDYKPSKTKRRAARPLHHRGSS